MSVANLLAGRERTVAVAAAFALLAIVAWLDFELAGEISLAIFYLPPVALVAWFAGPRAGIAFGLLAAVAWALHELGSVASFAKPLAVYWNAIMVFGFFVFAVILLARLKVALEHERELSREDQATGVANARAFDEWSAREIERARRYRRPITFVYVDCDDFKVVNDRHGHAEGDDVLREVARALREVVRELDLVARIGGDEFAVVLPETDQAGARVAVGRMREGLLHAMGRRGWPVTCSMGVASFTAAVGSPEAALRKADELMYLAKRRGKNTVEFATFGDAPE